MGRAREVEDVRRLLARCRLVTLTGPPGIGKTRLAVEAAAGIRGAFPGGVWFVSLAAATNPDVALAAVMQAVGLSEHGGDSPLGLLTRYFARRRALLILDNCEQVIDLAPSVAELLAASPSSTVLATSRERLRLSLERPYRVPLLGLPPERPGTPLDHVLRSDAVRLFVDEAQLIEPGFVLTEANAPSVVAISRQLDGLPLAIELAAARIALSPQGILNRLTDAARPRLALLTKAPRDAPPRHATLGAALAWSYDLLDPDEQALFRRLAVFVGGFGLEHAAGVAEGLATDAGALVDSLVEKSLLEPREEGDARRYAMLETVREYASQRLVGAEAAAAARRHAEIFAALARRAGAESTGPRQVALLDAVEDELDNVRAALRWTVEAGAAELAGELGSSLWPFWLLHGRVAEGRRWMAELLGLRGLSNGTRAALLFAAGCLSTVRDPTASAGEHYLESVWGLHATGPADDLRAARSWFEAAAALSRGVGDGRGFGWSTLGAAMAAHGLDEHDRALALAGAAVDALSRADDQAGVGWALNTLGRASRAAGDPVDRYESHFADAVATWRRVGDCWGRAVALRNLANVAYVRGDHARAAALFREAVPLFRRIGLKSATAWVLNSQAEALRYQGDVRGAGRLYEEALALFGEVGVEEGVAWSLHNLGHVAIHAGEPRRAADLFRRALGAFREVGNEAGIAACLVGLAGAAIQLGSAAAGARLLGAAEARLERAGRTLEPVDRVEQSRHAARLDALLGANALAVLRAEGRERPLEHLLNWQDDASLPAAGVRDLTGREVDVLRLVAVGCSDKEIATRLVISTRTVHTHLARVRRKLDVQSRLQAVRRAEELGIDLYAPAST